MSYPFEMYSSFYGSFVAMADQYGMTAKYDLTVSAPSGRIVRRHGVAWGCTGLHGNVNWDRLSVPDCVHGIERMELNIMGLIEDIAWACSPSAVDAWKGIGDWVSGLLVDRNRDSLLSDSGR